MMSQNIRILEISGIENGSLEPRWLVWITYFKKLQKLAIDYQMDESRYHKETFLFLTKRLITEPLYELKEFRLKINDLFKVNMGYQIILLIFLYK